MKTLTEEINDIMLNLEAKIKQQISETEELKGKINSKQYLYNEISSMDTEISRLNRDLERKSQNVEVLEKRLSEVRALNKERYRTISKIRNEYSDYRENTEAIILSFKSDIKSLKRNINYVNAAKESICKEREALRKKYNLLENAFHLKNEKYNLLENAFHLENEKYRKEMDSKSYDNEFLSHTVQKQKDEIIALKKLINDRI